MKRKRHGDGYKHSSGGKGGKLLGKALPSKAGEIAAHGDGGASLASGEPLRSVDDKSGAGKKYAPFGGAPKAGK